MAQMKIFITDYEVPVNVRSNLTSMHPCVHLQICEYYLTQAPKRASHYGLIACLDLLLIQGPYL